VSLRPARREDLPLAALWALGAACALACAPMLPWLARWAGPCPLHALTGVPCLTCGSTRAALALARGDVAAAVASNPLVTVAIVAGLLGGAVAPAWAMLGWPVPRIPATAASRLALAAALAANWIYLVAHGA
jgi:hypothetical protein